ncbi:MAG: GNAT family N-acetyltransferase [Thiotrichales bacterium]
MATSQSGIRFHVISSLPELESFESTYRSLFEASDASPYYSYEWMHAYLTHHSAPDGVFICVALDVKGPLAIVPLAVRRDALATRLEPFGDGPANVNTGCVLPRAMRLPIVRMAADWVRDRHIRWDYLTCEKMPEVLGHHFESGADPDDSGMVATRMDPSVVIDLPATWDDYLASRSRNHRKEIKRQLRAIAAAGELRVERLGLDPGDDPADVDRLIEDAATVSRLSWQGTAAHGHAICDDDWIGFFRDSSRALARRGMLDLGVLYLDERPVAFVWGHARGGKSWVATSGFDQAWRDYSPGSVLDALIIQDSIARGMGQLDWGHEFREYKQRWATGGTPMVAMCQYANRYLGPLKRRAQSRWDRSVAPRLAAIRFAPGIYVGVPEFGI